MYPKEYHIQKHEGLEDLGREGAKKKFGKITAWFTEKKTLTSHPIQGGSFFFFLLQQSQLLLCSLPHRASDIKLCHKSGIRWITQLQRHLPWNQVLLWGSAAGRVERRAGWEGGFGQMPFSEYVGERHCHVKISTVHPSSGTNEWQERGLQPSQPSCSGLTAEHRCRVRDVHHGLRGPTRRQSPSRPRLGRICRKLEHFFGEQENLFL